MNSLSTIGLIALCISIVNGQNWYTLENVNYFISQQKGSHMKAKETCISIGSTLATPKTLPSQNFLKQIIREISGTSNVVYWIDLIKINDSNDDSSFKWGDGTTLLSNQSNWNKPGSTGGSTGKNRCVFMYSLGDWSFGQCSLILKFICQKLINKFATTPMIPGSIPTSIMVTETAYKPQNYSTTQKKQNYSTTLNQQNYSTTQNQHQNNQSVIGWVSGVCLLVVILISLGLWRWKKRPSLKIVDTSSEEIAVE